MQLSICLVQQLSTAGISAVRWEPRGGLGKEGTTVRKALGSNEMRYFVQVALAQFTPRGLDLVRGERSGVNPGYDYSSGATPTGHTVRRAHEPWAQGTRPFEKRAGWTAMDRGYATITVQSGSAVFAVTPKVNNVRNDPTNVEMER